MSTAPEILQLLAVDIRSEHDLMICRQRSRQFAELLGFDRLGQTAISTAVSEIARNAYDYAGGGKVQFTVETLQGGSPSARHSRQSLVTIVEDSGPGISNLDQVLTGEHDSESGLGIGIQGARRLMNDVTFVTSPKGTAVTLRRTLPPGKTPLTAVELQAIVDKVHAERLANPLEELQWQNQELMRVMADLHAQQDEISRANKELEETNTGVLALYDELETLHRVSLVLATKVDLLALIQAVVDATTELTMADFGVFFLHQAERTGWVLFARAGKQVRKLDTLPVDYAEELLSGSFGENGLEKVDLLGEEGQSDTSAFARSPLVKLLQGRVSLGSCLAVPVIDADGKLLGALVFGSSRSGVFSERSERIVSSIATQAVVAIEKARLFDSVKAASEAKDRFLAMLSHELRTPLNPVMAIVSNLFEDPSLLPNLREDIATVLRNVQLEARIIDDLLDFQRLINGKLDLRLEPVPLHTMIRNVLEICKADLTHKQHQVSLELNAVQATVLGDPARLQQALWNILKNAIKFTPPGGTLTIRTENRDGGRVLVAITDTGRGIEQDALPGIFDAFEQGGKAVNAEFGGLGLGLAITRTFVEKHGGFVTAASPGLNLGATITVDLPWVEAAESGLNPVAPGQGGDTKSGRQALSILLVDDHADTLNTLARLLRKRGYDVSVASSSTQALKVIGEKEIDLIVSDLGLPDRPGTELIGEIRNQLGASLPAIALSGYGMESDVAASLKAGFSEHLTKPVRIEVLHQVIEKLLK